MTARRVYQVEVSGTWTSTYEVHATNRAAAEAEARQAARDLAGDAVDALEVGRVLVKPTARGAAA